MRLERQSVSTFPAGDSIDFQETRDATSDCDAYILIIPRLRPGQKIIFRYAARSTVYIPTAAPIKLLRVDVQESTYKDPLAKIRSSKPTVSASTNASPDRQNVSAAIAATYLQQVVDRYQGFIDVYTEADAAANHFAARGEFDFFAMDLVRAMDKIPSGAPCIGITCITGTFDPRVESWDGWYNLNGILGPTQNAPIPNSVANAGYDIPGATALQLSARVNNGGEVVQFCIGNTALPLQTLPCSYSFDQVERNAAFVYDNAMVLSALIDAGDLGRERTIADAMLYAESTDRFFRDGRLKNAYQGGDIALPPSWTPNNQRNTGVFVGQDKRFYGSTEHNIDLYSAFSRLYLIKHSAKWAQAAQHAKTFFLLMWDNQGGKFWTGTAEDGITTSTAVVPVDIQAWSTLQALDSETQNYVRALDYVESNPKATFGFGFKQNGGNTWFEGTSQVALTYLLTGGAAKWHSALNDIHSAQSALPAADSAWLDTGFTPDVHMGVTAWLSLAEEGVNPFRSSLYSTSERVNVEVLNNGGADLRVRTSISDLYNDVADADNVRKPSGKAPFVYTTVLDSGGARLSIRIRGSLSQSPRGLRKDVCCGLGQAGGALAACRRARNWVCVRAAFPDAHVR